MFFYREVPIPPIVTDGLLFNLDAGNPASYPGTGSTWYDLSGNGRNATLLQDYNNLNNPLTNPLYGNGAITFINDQAAFVDDTSTRINGPSFTYESVFYFDNIDRARTLIQKRNSVGPYQQISFLIQADAQTGGDGKNLCFFINPDASNVGYRKFNYDLSSGGARIVHVTLVNDPTSARLYVNGILVATDSTPQPGSTFNISGFPTWVGWRDTAHIARVYNKALTQQEVTQNYDATKDRFQSTGSDLVLHLDAGNILSYPGTGTTWTDLSGRGNNGTLINGPTYSSANGGIISFDGVNDFMKSRVNYPLLDVDPTFSVSMFVRRRSGTNIGGDGGFWGIGGSGQRNSFEGWTPDANLISFDVYDSTRISSGQYYPENQWIHLVWTKNGTGVETTNMKCYINGSEVSLTKLRESTGANRVNATSADTGICLGRINSDNSSFPAPIDIGSFKVYKKAITSTEVLQDFNNIRSRYGL